jgi:hypothetical protein
VSSAPRRTPDKRVGLWVVVAPAAALVWATVPSGYPVASRDGPAAAGSRDCVRAAGAPGTLSIRPVFGAEELNGCLDITSRC